MPDAGRRWCLVALGDRLHRITVIVKTQLGQNVGGNRLIVPPTIDASAVEDSGDAIERVHRRTMAFAQCSIGIIPLPQRVEF